MNDHREGAACRGRILVADDNQMIQLSLGAILRRIGFDTTIVSDGRATLEELARERYGMVLMDLNMPVVNGIDCIRQIRRSEDEGTVGRLPVIAMTGETGTAVREECLSAGADDVLGKPFKLEELSAVLDSWFPEGDAVPAPAPSPGEGEGDVTGQPPSQPGSLNAARIAEIRRLENQGSAGLMRRMAELYHTGSPGLIERIRTALRHGDGEALALAAHELKSSSGSIGGERLCMLCSDMERLARQGLLDGAKGLLSLVEAEQQAVLAAISKVLSPEKD